jgi:hypothetical protein
MFLGGKPPTSRGVSGSGGALAIAPVMTNVEARILFAVAGLTTRGSGPPPKKAPPPKEEPPNKSATDQPDPKADDKPGVEEAQKTATKSATPKELPPKVKAQLEKAQLPQGGEHPFEPKLTRNKSGEMIIDKKPVEYGPRAGAKGYVDQQGRIWVRGEAHGNIPTYWDVEIDGRKTYMNVGLDGTYEPRIKGR